MSVPTPIQAKTVPMAISQDGGLTWKNVVCKTASNFNGTTSVNAEETDCGTFKGLGSPDWTMDFTGVVNTTPNSPTEMSAGDLGALWQDSTLIMVRLTTPYLAGEGYITDYAVIFQTGNMVGFSFTVNGQGAVDFTE